MYSLGSLGCTATHEKQKKQKVGVILLLPLDLLCNVMYQNIHCTMYDRIKRNLKLAGLKANFTTILDSLLKTQN